MVKYIVEKLNNDSRFHYRANLDIKEIPQLPYLPIQSDDIGAITYLFGVESNI
jgi:hypothetical protein